MGHPKYFTLWRCWEYYQEAWQDLKLFSTIPFEKYLHFIDVNVEKESELTFVALSMSRTWPYYIIKKATFEPQIRTYADGLKILKF